MKVELMILIRLYFHMVHYSEDSKEHAVGSYILTWGKINYRNFEIIVYY